MEVESAAEDRRDETALDDLASNKSPVGLKQPLLDLPERAGELPWQETSRVQVNGYLPDIGPFFRHPSKIEIHEPGTPSSPELSATPFSKLFKSGRSRVSIQEFFREGSVRGSVFNLCSATLGAGALSLPYAFSKTGFLLGLFFLIFAAIATLFSIHLLVVARNATGLKSYEDMTVALFGKNIGLVVEINIIVFCFGTCIAYCKAVGDVLHPILQLFQPLPGFLQGTNGDKVSICLFWAVVMFPLSLLKSMNSLRFSSFFGVASIMYLVVAAFVHSLLHVDLGQSSFSPIEWRSSALLAPHNFADVVSAMPIMMFAFTCQVNVFAIYSELERASVRRMGKVSNGAVGTCFCVYLFMGIFGFADFLDATQPNILTNYCIQQQAEPYMIAAFVAIVTTILMAFPLNVFPCRYTIESMLKNRFKKDTSSYVMHLVLTLFISGSALLVSLFVPNISIVFGLMGGTASAFVCFVLPAAFIIKLQRMERSKPEENQNLESRLMKINSCFVWALALGGGTIGALSTVVTIYGMIAPATTQPFSCDKHSPIPVVIPTLSPTFAPTNSSNALGLFVP